MHTVTLKEAQGRHIGSVFMDNLTLSCALRAVAGFHIGEECIEDRPRGALEWYSKTQPRRLYPDGRGQDAPGKCDYRSNDAFRLVIDIYSLAQLIEAIVLFDKVYVDASFVGRWGLVKKRPNSKELELPAIAAPLDKVIVPVSTSQYERLKLLANAENRTSRYVADEGFSEFLRILSVTQSENLFIQISNGYFRTGYSDPLLFPYIDDFMSPSHFDLEVSIVSRVCKQLEKRPNTDKIRDFLNFVRAIEKSGDFAVSLHQNPESFFVLRKTGYDPRQYYEKLTGSVDIIRNAVAAYFYQALAQNNGFPYFPHLMRSPFIIYDQIASSNLVSSVAKHAIDCVEECRRKRVDPINKFYRGAIIDFEIPLILAMVLEQVDKPDEILKAACSIRNSDPARSFRSWSAEVDQKVRDGTINIDLLGKELSKLERAVAKWGRVNNASEKMSVQLSVGLAPISLTFNLPSIGRPTLRQPQHLVFLQRLTQLSNRTPQFETLIHKVFGHKVKQFWARYGRIASQFSSPNIGVRESNQGTYPLDKRTSDT
jgi:hypothetical protein